MVVERTETLIDPAWCRDGAVIPDAVEITDQWWEAFVEANAGYKVELLRHGKVARRMNAFVSSYTHVELVFQLRLWRDSAGRGVVLDGSIEVRPAPRVKRIPDGAWLSPERIPQGADRDRPLSGAPDFVFEVVSPSQRGRMSDLDEKMQEWMQWGVRLAWLIDPHTRQVRIYRADGGVEDLDDPAELSGEDVMPGLSVEMSRVWVED